MEIGFPFGGLSDDSAFSRQPPNTSRDMRNMRGIDRVTGRMRGAQRSGMSKYVGTQVNGANKIIAIQPMVYDNPDLLTYASLATGSVQTVWSKTLPSNGSAKCGAVDDQQNVYVVDGPSGIAKYNSEGVLVWKLSLPIKDPKHEVRALAVDPITLDVFVGVGTGGDQDKAALWCARQLEDDKVEVRWEIVTKAYTQQIVLHQPTGYIYLVQNRPDRYQADAVVYGALTSAAPAEILRIEVPYPARCIAVRDNGDFYVGADTFTLRGIDPKAPGTGPRTTWWRPKVDFEKYTERVWAHWKATQVNGLDSVGEPEEGDEVLTLFDISGQDRHLYAASQLIVAGSGASQIQMGPPLYTKLGLGGMPAVSFRGKRAKDLVTATAGWLGDGLVGLTSNSVQSQYANAQRGAFPGFVDGSFAVVALIRPRVGAAPPSDPLDIGAIFAMQNKHAQMLAVPSDVLGAFVNRLGGAAAPGITLPGTFDSGCVSILDDKNAGANAPLDDNAAPYAINDANAVLLSFIYDARANGAGPPAATNNGLTFSLVRINGNYVDRYASPNISNLLEATVGFVLNATTPGTNQGFPLAFELLEMVVIARKRTSTGVLETTEPIVLSHPTTNAYGAGNFVPITATATTNELELWEGYMMHERGCRQYLKGTHPWVTNVPPATGQTTGSVRDPIRLSSTQAMLVKYTATGEMKWVDLDSGGLGYGVAILGTTVNDVYKPNSSTMVVTIGPVFGGNSITLRGTTDNGDSYTAAWNSGGGAPTAALTDPPYVLAVDQAGKVYFPSYNTDDVSDWTLKVYDGFLGTVVVQYDVGAGTANVPSYAVAIPPQFPDYPILGSPNRAEYAYVFGLNATLAGTAGQSTVRKLRLVTSTIGAVPPRLTTNLGVSNGAVRLVTTASVVSPAGAGTLTNPVLATTTQYVSSCVGFGLAFFADGNTVVVYNPKTDKLTTLVAKGAGKPLERASFVTRWRGRLGLLRGRDLPQTARFSAVGQPFNHDTQPPVITPDQAFDQTSAPAFAIPDTINGFVAASDDIAYVLCDSTVHRVTGDPMAGGEIHQLNCPTGGSFGRAWCKDGKGNIFFYGSRGGVWVISTGGYEAQEITTSTIAKRMRQFDLGDYYVLMEWNDIDDGLHVIPVPFGASNTLLRGWFWERKSGGWHEDTFNPNAYPTSLAVTDGDDPNDRALLVGCSDGYVRKWDRSKKDDDSYAIDGYVTWGPFSADEIDRELLVTRTEVILAGDQDGAVCEWFASDSPDRAPGGEYSSPTVYPPRDLGVPEFSEVLAPGHNAAILQRVRGGYLWLRVRNAAPDQSMAIEKVIVDASPAGRRRAGL